MLYHSKYLHFGLSTHHISTEPTADPVGWMQAQLSMRHQPVISTTRLLLRLANPWDTEDCQEIVKTYDDPDRPESRSASGIRTVADVREKFTRHGPREEYCTLAPPPNGMMFLVYLVNEIEDANKSNEALIGSVMLSTRPEMQYPDLGFGVMAAYEGHGYAFEAAQAVLDWWRETIGIRDIFCGTAPDNVRSQKLIERLGFVRAGTFNVLLGHPPNERIETGGLAYVLPGMTWEEGRTMRLVVGAAPEDPE